MFLTEPPATNYDLHFKIAGFPIRVHPFFWLLSLILALGPGSTGLQVVTWIGVVFVSITIHELGHAFAYRRYGMSARIVLHHFGGVAIADSVSAAAGWGHKMTPGKKIFISFAGPGAQFIVVILVIVILMLAGLRIPYGVLPTFLTDLLPSSVQPILGGWNGHANLWLLVNYIFWVNFYWAVLNLLPIYPLDGGQIARELFVAYGKSNSIRNSHILSIVVAALAIAYCIQQEERFMIMMFLMLGIENYMNLQRFYGRGGYGGGYGGGGRGPW